MKKLTLCAVSACAILLSAAGAQAATVNASSGYGIGNQTTIQWTDTDPGSCSGVQMPKILSQNTQHYSSNNVITFDSKYTFGTLCEATYVNSKSPTQEVVVTVWKDGASGSSFHSRSSNSLLAQATTYGAEMETPVTGTK